LEIKQCIMDRDGSRESAVRSALLNAQRQVTQYAEDCRTNGKWDNLEPWIVIVHDGDTRFAPHEGMARVLFLYVGLCPPSAGPPVVILEPSASYD
jgi:hypothetical protein